MRTSIAFVVAGLGLAVAIIGTAVASASRAAPSTIEQCAALLPQGKTYTFELVGSVDTTGSAPKLSGEMSVSDGSHVDISAESAGFAECLGKLIR